MFENLSISGISELILAAGALGTAAFAIVEGLKWLRFVGQFGFTVLIFRLGALTEALEHAYGDPYRTQKNSHQFKRGWLYNTWSKSDKTISKELWNLLRAQYRGDQAELERVLCQGVRIGLIPETADALASTLNMVDVTQLREVAKKVHNGEALEDEERNILGRFELAADARVKAALTLAQSHFKGKLQLTAAGVAILIALVAALSLFLSAPSDDWSVFGYALLIAILAVPVAPITHDLVDALKAVTTAIGPKS